ncbi:MAG TPA: hypothetical protein DEB60_05075 [Brevundimonas sp.]|nr:hypothetical protein [Brevundimonas sp.]
MPESTKSPAEVKERPILFSGPMVRALLDGRKTQTRRVMKVQPPTQEEFRGSLFGLDRAVADGVKMYIQNDYDRLPKHPTDWELTGSVGVAREAGFPRRYRCPYGAVGDRLWVKETWRPSKSAGDWDMDVRYEADSLTRTVYDGEFGDRDWSMPKAAARGNVSPLFMPRWAARLVLEITDVRVERLLDCSNADAQAEGLQWVTPGMWSVDRSLPIIGDDARQVYFELWDHINGAGSAEANPWVWAVSFRVLSDEERQASRRGGEA